MLMLFAFSFLLLASPVSAQTIPSTWKESPSTSLAQKDSTRKPTFQVSQTTQATSYQLPATIPTTSPLYTDLLVHNLFHSFSCLAVGQSVIGQPCLTYQVTKNTQGAIQSVPVLSQVNLQGGALGATTSVIGMLYQNQPVRTADYLASIGIGKGIIKEAHAQVTGSGANVLSPILRLWQVSRNVSYVFMIIIFVVIGLMVMFRNRINPQTVITAQTALPGLVIGLILITFSYLLAGLISDMAFVGTNIVGYYFSAVKGHADNPQNLVQNISSENILALFGRFVSIITREDADKVASIILNSVGTAAANNVRMLVGFFAAQFIGPISGSISGSPWGLVAAPIITTLFGVAGASSPEFLLGFLLSFVASLALIYQMIKLLLRLINSYLTIIFLTISAPFQFLFAALPGRQGVATGWILNMLANILVFPAVLAVLYFVVFILNRGDFGPLRITNANLAPNNSIMQTVLAQETPGAGASDVSAQGPVTITGKTTFPLFGGLDLSFVQILLAFGALMALPAVPDIVVRAVGRAGQAGQLIGQELGGGVAQGRQYAGQAQGAFFGRIQSGATEVAGKRGLVYDPGKSMFVRQVTEPGMMQVSRMGSWNPLNWKVKPPSR